LPERKVTMKIFNHFHHLTLTNDQRNALEKLHAFLESEEKVFLLKGYAGSGKTTLLKGVVDYLEENKKRFQLMAPTGRAAKVIQQKTGKDASTIHKGIYSFSDVEEIIDKQGEDTGKLVYHYRLKNSETINGSVLIIDEASMISDKENTRETVVFGSGFLLSDLLEYARIIEPGNNTKIIFIGDPAQLPPVGMNHSPALDENYFKEKLGIDILSAEIKMVVRQTAENGILNAATLIRTSMQSGFFNDFNLQDNGKDIFNPVFSEFLNQYSNAGKNKIVITYSNSAAKLLNNMIRKDRFGSELPVQEGDIMIAGANNYAAGVLNGEFAVVAKISPNAEMRDIPIKNKGKVSLVWRGVELVFPDDQNKSVSGFILENFLYGDNQIDDLVQQALQIDFKMRNPALKSGTSEYLSQVKQDMYCNPLKMKFGYAVTCHKAQGGEWAKAFIFWDYGALGNVNFFEEVQESEGKTNNSFYRWAYTAITRASEKLFCINPPHFSSFSGMTFVGEEAQASLQNFSGKSENQVEITITNEVYEELKAFGLANEHPLVQDNFLKIRYKLGRAMIDVVSWQKKGQYEVWYQLKRGDEKAAFKDWFNSKYQFKEKFTLIPDRTNSQALFDESIQLINTPINISISRNNAESLLDKIIFDYHVEESKPFLKALFDRLSDACAESQISIKEIKHNEWHDRYWFVKGNAKATLNFYYTGRGLFSRVEPLKNECDDSDFLRELRDIIDKLKSS